MISISNILSIWLKKKRGGKKFYIEERINPISCDIVRCKKCDCFTAFVNRESATLHLRLEPYGYNFLEAVDHEFLSKLENHLKEHICG